MFHRPTLRSFVPSLALSALLPACAFDATDGTGLFDESAETPGGGQTPSSGPAAPLPDAGVDSSDAGAVYEANSGDAVDAGGDFQSWADAADEPGESIDAGDSPDGDGPAEAGGNAALCSGATCPQCTILTQSVCCKPGSVCGCAFPFLPCF